MKLEIIRHIDKLGRICLPMDFRKSFGVTEKTDIIVTFTDEGILLKKREDGEKAGTDLENRSI